MTISPEIKQLNRQDFVEYLYQLQMFAKEKYSFDIFLENRLTNQDGFNNQQRNKRELGLWKNKIDNIDVDFNEPLKEFSDYM